MKANAANKKKKNSAPTGVGKGAKAKSDAPALNPFERKVTKSKHEILGRKLKGTESRTGQSRHIANEVRKNTLLKEFQTQNKVNAFVDKRFGEGDPSLPAEEKMLLRFQKERQKRFKHGSLYNLEEEEEELTHLGTSLSATDFKDDFVLSESDDENHGYIDEEIVRTQHFGGGFVPKAPREGGEDIKKSKKEIMEEIIAKSKFYKAERQREKREGEELTTQLDEQFRDLRESGLLKASRPLPSAKEKDEFQVLYRELATEMKARATDRLKTPEEIAQEEKERLETLERERLRRMTEDYAAEEAEEDGEATAMNVVSSRRSSKSTSADALDDDFAIDPAFQQSESEDEEDEEEDSDEEEEEEKPRQKTSLPTKQTSSLSNKSLSSLPPSAGGDDLPFTFAVPVDDVAWAALIEGRTTSQVATIIHRIRVCNDPRLAPENKQKMEMFYKVLFRYFGEACSKLPLDTTMMDTLCKVLFEMGQNMPSAVASAAKECLQGMEVSLQKQMVFLKLNKGVGQSSGWPSLSELLYLKLFSVLFPTSDFRHPIITPTFLYMAQCLAHCPVHSPKNAVAGLFLTTLMLHYVQAGKQYSPEPLNFLLLLLSHAFPQSNANDGEKKKKTQSTIKKQRLIEKTFATSFPGSYHLPSSSFSSNAAKDQQRNEETRIFHFEEQQTKKKKNAKTTSEQTPSQLHLSKLLSLDNADPLWTSHELSCQLLATSVRLLSEFSSLYFQSKDLLSYPEIFAPHHAALTKLISSTTLSVPQDLRSRMEELATRIQTCISRKVHGRRPLHQHIRPTPIATYIPMFQENYSVGKDYDPDAQRAEMKKLRRKYKHEMKGAMRELRKDNHFLQEERLQKRKRDLEERDKKTKEIMAFLSNQQHELREMDYLKKKAEKNSSSVL
ncbi:nucleolar complex protein 14 [Balamuthia mandrillaris]